MSAIGRRGFLGGALGALTALVTPLGRAGRALAGAGGAADPAARVARLVGDGPGISRIGAAYLAAVPEEGDPDLLVGLLTPEGREPETWWAATGLGQLRRRIRARARADFATGDVVDLEGWQLARTEARLAALARLTGSAEAGP